MADILFIHNNFPAQFGFLAKALVAAGHRCAAIASGTGTAVEGVRLIRWGSKRSSTPDLLPAATRIEAEVESGGTVIELAISLTIEGDRARRVIEVDGVRSRAFDLPGHFRVTLFWPDDLGLIKAGPEL